MFKEAFKFPLTAESRLRVLGAGGFLHLFPYLYVILYYPLGGIPYPLNYTVYIAFVISLVLLSGYSYRVFRAAAIGQEKAPGMNDFKDMFIKGMSIIIVFLSYILPGYIFLDESFVGLVLLIIGFALFPVAETNMVINERLLAAADLKSILRATFTRDYLIVVVFTGILFWTWTFGWMFYMAFSSVLIVTFVLLPVIFWGMFYTQVVVTHLVGSSIGERLG